MEYRRELSYKLYGRLTVILILMVNVCQTIDEASGNATLINGKVAKTILLWNPELNFSIGHKLAQSLTDFNCKVPECFVTKDRHFLDIRKFDAIIFHGIHSRENITRPRARSPSQSYVFFSNKALPDHEVDRKYNGMFNLTMTPRLDSDVPCPFVSLEEFDGRRASPAVHPEWIKPRSKLSNIRVYTKLAHSKTKVAAIVMFRCLTDSLREDYIDDLKEFIPVDVYGKCGTDCQTKYNCDIIIKEDYFFYLAFEEYFCVDYIGEQTLLALRNGAVPIIYGGANISRFLPPMSYIDAAQHNPRDLAAHMTWLMEDKDEYIKYFWWRAFYRLVDTSKVVLCRLCEILHDEELEPKVYRDLGGWWRGNKSNPICYAFPQSFPQGNLEES